MEHAGDGGKTIRHDIPNPHPATGHRIGAWSLAQAAPPGLGLYPPAKLQRFAHIGHHKFSTNSPRSPAVWADWDKW